MIYHGGVEYHHLPYPYIIKYFRFLIDVGADCVISHHTHCISGFEVYKDKPIFYSLGNFLFTANTKQELWYDGLILSLNIQKDNIDFELIPTKQDKETHKLSLCNNQDKKKILDKITNINKIIADDDQLLSRFNNYLDSSINRLFVFTPLLSLKPVILRKALVKFWYTHVLRRKKFPPMLLNLIRCESHLDVMQNLLRSKIR